MSHDIVHVPLGERSYDIVIGEDVLARAGAHLARFLKRPRVAVITDRNVHDLHHARLEEALHKDGIELATLVMEPGEATKRWDALGNCVEWLIEQKVARDDVVVAFGGGVIGDLAGFAAAILRRGVGFIQIPTTLLAQVDSSVGGKTGINSPQGKNLIGAFHQPRQVLIDVGLLDTLGARDYLAGYAEVMKYGLLGNASFFEWLEANARLAAAGDVGARISAIRTSCQMKADIVARDETEQGDRALLNLGHTFGHALEAATGYSDRLLHGEAVAIGCQLAFDASARMGLCAQETPSRVASHLESMGMKRRLSDIEGTLPDADALIALMTQDKKVRDGKIAFVLARDIGESFVTTDVDMIAIRDVLTESVRIA